MDSDSLWLQKSINLSDPFDSEENAHGRVSSGSDTNNKGPTVPLTAPASTPLGPVNASDIEAIACRAKAPMDISAAAFSRTLRPSVRMSSLANCMSGGFSADNEEMKSRLAQLNRERLKWEDTSRDLERTKQELIQCRDDYQTLEQYTKSIKLTADECAQRAERDAKARQEAESKLLETVLNSNKEVQAVKSVMEDIKKTHAHELYELQEKLDLERHDELTALQKEHDDKIAGLEKDMSEIVNEVAMKKSLCAQLEKKVADLEHQVANLQNEGRRMSEQMEADAAVSKKLLSTQAADFQSQIARMQNEHADVVESLRALHDEQTRLLREEAKTAIQQSEARIVELERRLEATKEEFFATRSALQDKASELKQAEHRHALDLQREKEEHGRLVEALEAKHSTIVDGVRAELKASAEEILTAKAATQAVKSAHQEATRELAAREGDIKALQAELQLRDEKIRSAISDIEVRDDDIQQMEELIQRLASEKESLELAFQEDLQQTRDRCGRIEQENTSIKAQLSQERKAHLNADFEYRRTINDLKAKLQDGIHDSLAEQTNDIQHLMDEKRQLATELETLRHRLNETLKEKSALAVESATLKNDKLALETELSMARNNKRPLQQPTATTLDEIPANVIATREAATLKKVRTEPRIIALTGFEGKEGIALQESIKKMSNCQLVECRSNAPVPLNLTHMISNGQNTIKLLTAIVRGCWILPASYIEDSIDAGMWLAEQEYGFRHEKPPLSQRRICFSNAFKASKNFHTAELLAKEGGAVFVDTADDADIYLCGSREAAQVGGITWEGIMSDIYPRKIC